MRIRNFRETNHKCCGNCQFLFQDEMSGHYLCEEEHDENHVLCADGIICFRPEGDDQYRFICDKWKGSD